MSKTFLIGDTHFCHSNILKFTKEDGTLLRPGFSSIQEHDEFLIDRWNSVVSCGDKVYHLGDVGFFNTTSAIKILNRLNGTKILIKGNHDNLKLSVYAQIFKDVRAYHVLDKFVLSHIPLHVESLYRWTANIHGHLHANNVCISLNGIKSLDPRYVNISCEQINFTPIDFEEIRSKYKKLIPNL